VLVRLGSLEEKVLMKLQYEFPLTPTPYSDVASEIGIGVDELLSMLRRLHAEGVVKRIGFYYNPRSRGVNAVLVAMSTPRPVEASGRLDELLEVTHSYLRDHPVYNLWVVVRYREWERLVEAVMDACRVSGCTDYVILPATRLHRLSVKYDLAMGISRAGPYSRVRLDPPSPEELGVPGELPRLVRRLPLRPHPYREAAQRLGMGEEEVVDYIVKLLREGVLGDPGATLNGQRIGFTVNAMYVAEPYPGVDACAWVSDHVPYATHIVTRRIVPEDSPWRYTCFFMVHAAARDRLRVVDELLAAAPVTRWDRLVSLTDLKPGAQR